MNSGVCYSTDDGSMAQVHTAVVHSVLGSFQLQRGAAAQAGQFAYAYPFGAGLPSAGFVMEGVLSAL